MLRNQLDVFNCTETDPSDDNSYTAFTSPSCGGLCKCWEEGSLQMSLVPFAVITFLCYSVGFVVFLYYTLKKYRLIILEDQYLRAQGHGNNATPVSLGDACYLVRKRYSRVYYHFRPEHYYWIIVIIGRKTAIAMTSLLYRKNPSFQFAVALLVMFSAYMLQVKCQPYMSPSSFKHEVRNFKKHAKRDPKGEYGRVKQATDMRLYHFRKRNQSKGMRKRGESFADPVNEKTPEPIKTNLPTRKFNVNYNSVESILLACSVFVCWAGICFENAAADGPFKTERKGLTWITLFVIITSIVYFMSILVVEIAADKGYQWAIVQDKILDISSGTELRENAGLMDVEVTKFKFRR